MTLDPRRLTPYGELVALMAGLLTYHHTGGHIAWRDPASIARSSADVRNVHHIHVCNSPPGIEYRPTVQQYAATYSDPLNPPY